MREVFTFTIDPADAKDFDDAISFERLSVAEGDDLTAKRSFSEAVFQAEPVYRIGVHIADVSYYVKPGTEIDDEAYRRGTSVYLVDRVIPMLPEELCNDKCSLRPGEDKLCMSVVFTFAVPLDAEGQPLFQNAQIVKHKICRTVIRSDARLDYDQAQAILTGYDQAQAILTEQLRTAKGRQKDGKRTAKDRNEIGTMSEALRVLNELARKLRAERIANGALTIEQDEVRFRLDEHHHPTEIYLERPNEAHHLIEEFMLLANRTVAKEVGKGRPFVYRVHDLPDYDKLEEIKKFKKEITKRRNGKIKGQMVNDQIVNLLTIRAQAKAVYSTYNIGHYGLAFTHYTHFTSPIRRYPDLMVHRLVEKYILSPKRSGNEALLQPNGLSVERSLLEEMCEHCSACEQEATQAERDSIKLFQAMWMAEHLGEILPGHITSILDFGFFVQLDESRCEGLVRMELIEHPEDFVLGDPVMVQVIRVDVNRSQIDFEFA